MVTSAFLLAALIAPQSNDLDRYVYPLAKPIPSPKFVIDVSDDPDSKEWAESAKKLAEEWFPHVCSLLATEDYKPPKEIRLVFRKKQDAPAYASGPMISFNGEWIKQRQDDLGMVIHELTHVIQAYPGNRHNAGWVTEGIADYIRWVRYEPEAPRRRIDKSKSSFRSSYHVTAYFLAYSAKKYNMALVPMLDRAMRKAEDPMPVFVKATGKTAEELWKEYADTLP